MELKKKKTSECKNDSIYIFRDRDTLEITAISLHMNTEMYIKRKVRKVCKSNVYLLINK